MRKEITRVSELVQKAQLTASEKAKASYLTEAIGILDALKQDAEASIVFTCPRCKWSGKEYQLTQITKDGEKAIDYADGSPVLGCPICGEHKLTEA